MPKKRNIFDFEGIVKDLMRAGRQESYKKTTTAPKSSMPTLEDIRDLKMQAIESKYANTGNEFDYAGALKTLQGNIGSNINAVRGAAAQGDKSIADAYAALQASLNQGATNVGQTFQEGTQRLQGVYDKGTGDLQAIQSQLGDQYQQEQLKSVVNEILARQTEYGTQSVGGLSSLGTGTQGALQAAIPGYMEQGTRLRTNFANEMARQLAELESGGAEQLLELQERSRASQTDQGKMQAELLNAQAGYLEDLMKGQGRPKGEKGVYEYASQMGRSDLANQLMQLISGAPAEQALSFDETGTKRSIDDIIYQGIMDRNNPTSIPWDLQEFDVTRKAVKPSMLQRIQATMGFGGIGGPLADQKIKNQPTKFKTEKKFNESKTKASKDYQDWLASQEENRRILETLYRIYEGSY